MKNTILIISLLMLYMTFPSVSFGQAVSINTDNSSPDASAILDVKSTIRGMLVPRMTSAQRTGIPSPAIGLLVYDTDTQSFWFRNATIWVNLSSGAGGWSLTGNAATATDFMGTTNNQSLLFKANNLQAGKIDLPLENTFWGNGAGKSITTGSFNTATGHQALYSNVNGNSNTAIGYGALYSNVAGHDGVAIGYFSQYYANNSAVNWDNTNTSIGLFSLRGSTTPANNTGINNTAIGRDVLISNSSGINNTGNGFQTLFSNTTGNSNTAIGN
ncbi:MAG: hypothetical protein ABJB16_09755, partial [Saprospiraceae bacterium]